MVLIFDDGDASGSALVLQVVLQHPNKWEAVGEALLLGGTSPDAAAQAPEMLLLVAEVEHTGMKAQSPHSVHGLRRSNRARAASRSASRRSSM